MDCDFLTQKNGPNNINNRTYKENKMELSKEMQERVNRGWQQRAEFRKNKKYCDRRIADHILACIKS